MTGLFDDLFGVGWRLVAAPDVTSAIPIDIATWFSSIGGRVVTIGPSRDVHDVDGTYAEWFADRGVQAALQRPELLPLWDDIERRWSRCPHLGASTASHRIDERTRWRRIGDE